MKRTSKIIISLIPILFLILSLGICISIFGSDSILGASQVCLLASAGLCIALGCWCFHSKWSDFEDATRENIGEVTSALIILFLIGAISGTWTMSGIVPTFIWFGLKVISPDFFLPSACIICALVSLTIGSSWTTIATIGVALLGIGRAEGFSDPVIAGAIISGAYFGDKISPLSDTTVMASSVNRVPLFTHIRYMLKTTVPSILITLVIFTVMGLLHEGAAESQVGEYSVTLANTFNLSPFLMIVPVLTGYLIYKRKPAIIILGLSVLMAAVCALIFQPDIIREIGRSVVSDGSPAKTSFAGIVRTVFDTVEIDSGNEAVNKLLVSKGMGGMLNTVFLIICAMCFGACMKASGMIGNLASLLRPVTGKRGSLVASTVATGTILNGIVSDQYLSIILTSNIYKDIYEEQGYEARLLSRSVEDSATVTSPLIPWSSCGMTQATILGVSTLSYFPFCFFNLISPLMSITVALLGFGIPAPNPAPEPASNPAPDPAPDSAPDPAPVSSETKAFHE